MDKINKKLGFGFMRPPMIGESIDVEQLTKMVDSFIEAGFNYFDTAHGYCKQLSEKMIKECLTSRYDRSQYLLANKLSSSFFKTEEDIRPLFDLQLDACGVDYFDFYLMHAQGSDNYEQYTRCNAYQVAKQLKEEGKIRHLGISFHDKASFLERILTEHPEVEFVQIQFNYADYSHPAIESGKVYETCRSFGKPVIVMEPVKGGHLAKLSPAANSEFATLGSASPASYAIRFAAGFEGVIMVLSGMSSMEQLTDNISFMKDFKPLNEKESATVRKVQILFENLHLIACTACRYCVEGCPKSIPIPDLFACMNNKNAFEHDWNAKYYYNLVTTHSGGGKASECIQCGACEKICPQHLQIRNLLKDVAAKFE